jgi:hypothetical protein
VKRIANGDGYVYYDFQYSAPTAELAESPVPRWLLDRLGVDFFHSVKEVGSEDPSVVPELPRFGRLERLAVGTKEWTDKDIAPIARLRGLKSLVIALGDTETLLPPTGDLSLAVIANLPQLESAWVAGSRITPRGIESLSRSTSLRGVNVSCADPNIDARAAEPFRGAGRVTYFRIERFTVDRPTETVVEWDSALRRPVAASR